MARIRITVVKRTAYDDLIERFADTERCRELRGACALWTDGQEFVIEDRLARPNGFPCEWAWTCIFPDVATTLFGGDLWLNHPEASYTCCQSGLRPVVFKLERLTGSSK